MNPEPPLHPTSVPTRRKPIPRGRFRERVGLGCVLAYPYVTLRRLITCFGAPHVLHFRTDATVGSLACSWRCHLRHDREPCCGGANHYGSQRPELRLLLWLGAAPATGGLHCENDRDFRSKTRKDEARRTQRFSGLPHSADRGLCHRGPRSRRRAQTVPQRQAKRNRACRSWDAGRLSRHGRRDRGAVRTS